MKRFYSDATARQVDGGWGVALDGRAVRTQGGQAQCVLSRALAESLADEWRAQGEEIDPHAFPLRDMADLAIDHVAPGPAETIDKLLRYAETDTLCYRAEPDEPLFRRQDEVWEPLLSALEQRASIRFNRIGGVGYRPQPPATLDRLRSLLEGENAFTLAALTTLASLAASLSIALLALEDEADAEALFAAANLEEDWQAEQWGWDAPAAARRATRLETFRKAAHFARAARG